MSNKFINDLASLINYLNLDINPIQDSFEILYYNNIIYVRILKDKKLENKTILRKLITEDLDVIDFDQKNLSRGELKDLCISLYKQNVDNKTICTLLNITASSLFGYLSNCSKSKKLIV
jgi:hypothetical protein